MNSFKYLRIVAMVVIFTLICVGCSNNSPTNEDIAFGNLATEVSQLQQSTGVQGPAIVRCGETIIAGQDGFYEKYGRGLDRINNKAGGIQPCYSFRYKILAYIVPAYNGARFGDLRVYYPPNEEPIEITLAVNSASWPMVSQNGDKVAYYDAALKSWFTKSLDQPKAQPQTIDPSTNPSGWMEWNQLNWGATEIEANQDPVYIKPPNP